MCLLPLDLGMKSEQKFCTSQTQFNENEKLSLGRYFLTHFVRMQYLSKNYDRLKV